jgi:acyl-CoA synthetase (NDP forming)
MHSEKPVGLSWLEPPDGIVARLAASGVMVFTEHARLIRAAAHVARYAADLRHRIRVVKPERTDFPWSDFARGESVVTEHTVAAILTASGLPVSPGRIARTCDEAISVAREVGFNVATKRSHRRSPTGRRLG